MLGSTCTVQYVPVLSTTLNQYFSFLFFLCKVPDRGGRPSNVAPPVEMPSFKKRTEAPRDQRPQSKP